MDNVYLAFDAEELFKGGVYLTAFGDAGLLKAFEE